jgi:hypothetical protein
MEAKAQLAGVAPDAADGPRTIPALIDLVRLVGRSGAPQLHLRLVASIALIIASKALGAGFHKTFEAGHSDDRVRIWLSFEAATHQHWISGNGFGSTLNMQNAPVAAEVPLAAEISS